MSYIIFGDSFTFPEGNAATNRVYTYAKGFLENGVNTYVICFYNDTYPDKQGIVDGIHYFTPYKPVQRSRSFFARRWFKIEKYFSAFSLIRKIDREDKISAIIVYTKEALTHASAFLISRVIGCKLIIENSEHPLRYFQSNFLVRLAGNAKLRFELLTNDGILLISKQLIDFYLSKTRKSEKLFLVPSTVDPSRFANQHRNEIAYDYIGYFGAINFDRDNVDLLVRAYAGIAEKHKNIHLVLGGFCLENDKALLNSLISELGISSTTHLLDYLSREEVTRYIANAKMLVLVRSKDPFTDVSYPSKLTEYLAAGRPVISVKVGEIPQYLHDNRDAFLVDPGNVEALEGKMDYVLSNYDQAEAVGRAGRELTLSVFNYRFQAKRIIAFVNDLT